MDATGHEKGAGDVLTLPDGGPALLEASPRLADAPALVDASRVDADRLADSQDAVDAAAGRLLAQHGADAEAVSAWSASLIAEAGPDRAPTLYQAAGAALDEGRVAEALALLGALAATPSCRPDAILGLAVCAARLHCYEDGLVLAGAAETLMPDHPRPRYLAGLCSLELGNRRAAQAHLAAAARIARRDPAFRDELRASQRTLLLMHIG